MVQLAGTGCVGAMTSLLGEALQEAARLPEQDRIAPMIQIEIGGRGALAEQLRNIPGPAYRPG